jgi:hypothetical protein
MNENQIFIPKKVLFLIKLSYYKGKSGCLSDYIRYLGYEDRELYRPDVWDVLRFLISNDILMFDKMERNVKLYKLNKRKLTKLIDSLSISRVYYKYFDTHKTIINL